MIERAYIAEELPISPRLPSAIVMMSRGISASVFAEDVPSTFAHRLEEGEVQFVGAGDVLCCLDDATAECQHAVVLSLQRGGAVSAGSGSSPTHTNELWFSWLWRKTFCEVHGRAPWGLMVCTRGTSKLRVRNSEFISDI